MLAQRAGSAHRQEASDGSRRRLRRPRASGALTDADLVCAAREGDDRAFEQLYRRHRDQVIAELLRVVRDRGLAEDLAQDVFIVALCGIRESAGPISFRAWIREVARNAAIDSYRRSRRRAEVALEHVAEHDGDGLGHGSAAAPAPPDVALERKHSLRQLSGAFRGLDRVQHEILVLRELEGRSYGEIGERLGLSGPAVESTLYRARRRLSAEYRELLSGERCVRVRALLDASLGGRLGVRDHRTMQRHVAWCSPCRSYAGLAGIAVPRTLPQRVGALLPLPGLAPLVAWWLRLGRHARGLGRIRDRARGLGRHAGMVAEGVSRSGGDPISAASVPLIGVAVVLALGLGSDAGTKAQAAAHQHAAALNARAGTSGGVLPGSDVAGDLPGGGASGGPPSGAGATGSGSSGGARGGGAGAAGTGGSFGAGAGSPPAAGGSGPGLPGGPGGAQGSGSRLASGAGGVVGGAGGVVGGVVSGAGGVVNGVVSGAGGVVNGVVGGAVSGATSTVGKTVQSAGAAVQSVGSSVGKLPVVGASAGSTVSSAGGTVSSAASTVSNAGSAVASAGSSVSSTGTNAATSAVSGTTSTVSGATATTTSTVTAASSTVSGLLSSGLGA